MPPKMPETICPLISGATTPEGSLLSPCFGSQCGWFIEATLQLPGQKMKGECAIKVIAIGLKRLKDD